MKPGLKTFVLGVFLMALAVASAPASACSYTEYDGVLSEEACIGICRYYGCSNYEYLDGFSICYCQVPWWKGTGIPLSSLDLTTFLDTLQEDSTLPEDSKVPGGSN